MSDFITTYPWRWPWGDEREITQRQIAALTTLLAPHVPIIPDRDQAAFEEWLPGAAERIGVPPKELRVLLGWLAAEEAAHKLVRGKRRLLPNAERLGQARTMVKEFKTALWVAAGRPRAWWDRG